MRRLPNRVSSRRCVAALGPCLRCAWVGGVFLQRVCALSSGNSVRPPRPVKKTEVMSPWRTTTEMALAIFRYMALHRISYGELVRRAVSVLIAGDPFHDFEAHSVSHGATVFPDSAFDPASRV